MSDFPWNGSKRWLAPQLSEVFSRWDRRGRFVDPFVGGGSVSKLVRAAMPEVPQVLGDANLWLAAVYERQVSGSPVDLARFAEVAHWRGLRDADASALSVGDRALRFAVCLLTAWGNRWETRADGAFRSTLNPKYCEPAGLRRRLEGFFAEEWLVPGDQAGHADALATLAGVRPGDLVYLDPPYPEVLGYGNQTWTLEHHLDLLEWAAPRRDLTIVVSNPSTLRRLWEGVGFECQVLDGPAATKTRRPRRELLACRMPG